MSKHVLSMSPFDWMLRAQCRNLPVAFEDLEVSEQDVLCGKCPVRDICESFEMRTYTSPTEDLQRNVTGWTSNPKSRGALRVGSTCKHGHFIASKSDLHGADREYPGCKECSRASARASYRRRKAKKQQEVAA